MRYLRHMQGEVMLASALLVGIGGAIWGDPKVRAPSIALVVLALVCFGVHVLRSRK